MAKKGSAPFIKKFFPGLTRISKESGERVWIFEGKEFKTKAQVQVYKYPPKSGIESLEEKAKQAESEAQKLSVPQ